MTEERLGIHVASGRIRDVLRQQQVSYGTEDHRICHQEPTTCQTLRYKSPADTRMTHPMLVCLSGRSTVEPNSNTDTALRVQPSLPGMTHRSPWEPRHG